MFNVHIYASILLLPKLLQSSLLREDFFYLASMERQKYVHPLIMQKCNLFFPSLPLQTYYVQLCRKYSYPIQAISSVVMIYIYKQYCLMQRKFNKHLLILLIDACLQRPQKDRIFCREGVRDRSWRFFAHGRGSYFF